MGKTEKSEKYIIVSMCLVVMALVVLNLYQYHQIRNAINQTAGDRAALSGGYPASGIVVQKDTPEKSELTYLKEQIAAAKEELAMVDSDIEDEKKRDEEESRAQAENRERVKEERIRHVKSSAYREDALSSIEQRRDELFTLLDLSPERLEELKNIMTDYYVEESLLQYNLNWGLTQTEEQQTEYRRRVSELEEAYEAELSEFLGPEKYEIYSHYGETRIYRRHVQWFIGSFDMEEPLSDVQIETLIDGMYEAQKQAEKNAANENDGENAAEIDSFTKSVNKFDRSVNAYLEAAEKILNPEQFEQFEAYWDKWGERIVRNLNKRDTD